MSYFNVMMGMIPTLQFCRVQLPLVPLPMIYRNPAASLWLVHAGVDLPGRSSYFVSDDGKRFRELMEIANRRTDSAHIIGLEEFRVGKFRFEREGERARFVQESDAGEKLIAGALVLLGAEAVKRTIKRGDFHLITGSLVRERSLKGDISAILNEESSRRLRGSTISVSPIGGNEVRAIAKAALTDERAFAALAVLAERYNEDALDVLRKFPVERIAVAARHYEGPRHILWERAKEKDVVALEALTTLAMDTDEAIDWLINLYTVWKVPRVAEALSTIRLGGRDLGPGGLQVFADAGHPDAKRLLTGYDPKRLIAQARENTWAYDLMNCPPVRELGILVRHGDQKALDGLIALYREGHLVAREMVKTLIEEKVLRASVIPVIDLRGLKRKAIRDPRAVIALHRFHKDGHPRALEALRSLPSVDRLIELASESYDAVFALLFLHDAGDPRIRGGIDRVSTAKWESEYNLSGHSKVEGREARQAMSILASLGNEAATSYEGVVVPQRFARTVATLRVLSEIEHEGVKVVAFAPPPLSAEREGLDEEPPSLDPDEDDTLH